MKNATLSLWTDTDFSHATHRLVDPMASHMAGPVSILPSSLDPKDVFAHMVESALPEDASPTVAVPVTGAAARRAFLTPYVIGKWIDRTVRAAGASIGSVTFPVDIAQANHRVVVVDVVEVARHGPFVLDLPARYIHPRQRMRLLASGRREGLAAEVGSAFSFDLIAVYLAQRQGVALMVTTDPIAAELAALAMSELCVGGARSFTGPWEDQVVQRATELEMGVLLPQRIRLVHDGPARHEAWAMRVHDHLRMRLGIPE